MPNAIKRRMKFVKTCNAYMCFFTLGLAISLTGPCLLDLQHMVHTDTQHIAMIYTAKSIGYLLGAIIGGVLLDLIRCKQAVMMSCNLFVTITMFGIPWCRNVDTLLAFMSLNGLCGGTLETGANVICLELWGKDSNPIFQGLHFAFSLGGLLSPLLAAPFLENTKELPFIVENDNTTTFEGQLTNWTSTFFKGVTNNTNSLESIPRIIYPFTVVGGTALFVTVLHLVVCIISPTDEKSSEDIAKTDNSQRSLLFMFFTTIFTFVNFFVVAGIEIGCAQTLTIYSVKGKLHLTNTQGSYITSAYWAALTIGRLASVFLSIKISCLKLIIGDVVLVAIAALILLFLMPEEWAIWLASATAGAGIASAYAALVGWLNDHITITNKFSATFTVAGAAGDMIIPFLITYYIDAFPEMFPFVIAASAILMGVFVFMLYCMFKKGNTKEVSQNIGSNNVGMIENKY